jgi:hypothetical protein
MCILLASLIIIFLSFFYIYLIAQIFGTIDMFRRKTEVLKSIPGNFAVTCGASAMAYIVCWPLETLKNLAQSGRLAAC